MKDDGFDSRMYKLPLREMTGLTRISSTSATRVDDRRISFSIPSIPSLFEDPDLMEEPHSHVPFITLIGFSGDRISGLEMEGQEDSSSPGNRNYFY